MKISVFFLLFFITFKSYSFTTGLTFRAQFNHSDYVGIIEIIDIIKFEGCGNLVIGKSLKAFKGEADKVKFWAKNEKDFLIDSDRYLAFLSKRRDLGSCNFAELSAGNSLQTIFPFKNYYGKVYVLANRESFMASNDDISYFSSELIEMSQVINQRIYVFAVWKELEKELMGK